MIAFDTNLLVRLAVNDDEEQAEIAEQLLNLNEVFVSRTVLLETEWVLRSVYKNSRSEIANYFESTLVTKNLIMENAVEITYALEWYKLGADFADAIHLCICGESIFQTFDTEFCKAAHKLQITPDFRIL
ncbi:MAG: type II toxin-antitoxin system VapC family toxin [Thiotrichaceae bacterium]